MLNLKVVKASLILAFIGITGCTTTTASVEPVASKQIDNLIIGEPAPADVMNQRALVRISQVLAHVEDMTDEQRAELLYQRGKIYDGFGLRGLAQFDFETALRFKPNLAEAYNFLGIHHTQNRDYVDAYQAFDSALEIDPEHDYAFLNRGIALYYGGRPELAVNDLRAFYSKDEEDPYRALWIYIADREVDAENALSNLRTIRAKLNDNYWATKIVDFYLGDINKQDLLSIITHGIETPEQLTKRLCEVYFYLGKHFSAEDEVGVASSYFKLTLSTNVYQYVEHRYARLELSLLREKNFEERKALQP